jgi:endonuclease YncB( thermonuclease family)
VVVTKHRLGQSESGGSYGCMAVIVAFAALLIAWPKDATAVTVIDAQTLSLTPGTKVRLFDIVTPRSAQCGCVAECLLAQRALAFLQKTLSQAETNVRVESFGYDADGAVRARVFVNSRDLSLLMIQNGFAQPAAAGRDLSWCRQ